MTYMNEDTTTETPSTALAGRGETSLASAIMDIDAMYAVIGKTKSALQNAVSVANLVLTTDCLIVETEEERERRTPMPKMQ